MEEEFFENRVFINLLDSFRGKHISNLLSGRLFRNIPPPRLDEGLEEEAPPVVDLMLDPANQLKYEIVGTSASEFYRKTEDVLLLLDENSNTFIDEIFKCGFVVYDITNPEEIPKAEATLKAIEKKLENMAESQPKLFAEMKTVRVFVLISTALTWAKTKPIDPDDVEVPFVEADYRKRRAHPNYKAHIDLEREVMLRGKKGWELSRYKNHLRTIVICSGIAYGYEEEILGYLFKKAWTNELELPVINNGSNTIPLIHIKDLASILFAIFEVVPKNSRYIFATEQLPTTQKQIIKAISKNLGPNRIKNVSLEEALLVPGMNQVLLDHLTMNVKWEPGFILNDIEIPWQSELNFAENIKNIIDEYKVSLNLLPINILIVGPPAVGKTTLARKLCQFYGLHYISPQSLIEDTIATLFFDINYLKAQMNAKQDKEEDEENEDEEDEEDDLEALIQDMSTKLADIERILEESGNRTLPENYLIDLLKEKLTSNPIQNQGYVLDGFPETIEQGKEIFDLQSHLEAIGEEEEEEAEGDEKKLSILPNHIISLEASDDFLCQRVMYIPESEADTLSYNEETMIKRLSDFRTNFPDDDNLLDIFNEIEIYPFIIDVMTMESEDKIFEVVQNKIGGKRDYPPTDDDLRSEQLRQDYLKELADKEKEEKMKKEEADTLLKHYNNMEQWHNMMAMLQEQQEHILVARGTPMREYLIKYIFPTLTKGLLEVARVKPNDPVDFLAEYLFKINPEGRMFDPTYTANAEILMKTMEEFHERINQ